MFFKKPKLKSLKSCEHYKKKIKYKLNYILNKYKGTEL